MRKTMKQVGKKIIILAGWLLLWQIVADAVGRPVFLVGPRETWLAWTAMVQTGAFWQTILASTGRIAAGFFLAFAAGLAVGGLSYRFPLVGDILSPILALMKSIPVASFVILALIWAGSRHLTLVVSFFVVFPMIEKNTLAGFQSADPELLEMTRVFQVSPGSTLWQIYRPALAPYLSSACELALGMAWKSGVAAEVIGTPDYSIGEKLYMAKIYFSTDELFAWTMTILILSFLFEKAVMAVLRKGLEVRI
jgi:NitT/TauT family transport system permease protein